VHDRRTGHHHHGHFRHHGHWPWSRALKGPTIYDRIVAVNVFGTKTVLVVALITYITGHADLIDVALVYALINFIAVVAVLKLVKNARSGAGWRGRYHRWLSLSSTGCPGLLLLAGGAFGVIGGLGLMRFPDFYSRLHAAGMTDTLCALLIVLGLILQSGFSLLTSQAASDSAVPAVHRTDRDPCAGPGGPG
jgi:multicomponent Na+:H+ antiporter subunit F